MLDAFSHCEALVRATDKDRFLAVLFAPAEHRAALFALYAFNVEVSRVREAVREPLAGEIRLQWWTDALSGQRGGEAAANPVAAALLAAIARYQLDGDRLRALVEARRFDLYDEPMQTLVGLTSYAEDASSSLFELAMQILGSGHERAPATLSRHAGLAHAVAGLLDAFPRHAARGQLYVPLELLERHGASPQDIAGRRATPGLRAALAELRRLAWRQLSLARELLVPPSAAPALLPVALVGPTLTCMERPDYDPFVPVKIAPWRRQWLIWRAARRPARLFR